MICSRRSTTHLFSLSLPLSSHLSAFVVRVVGDSKDYDGGVDDDDEYPRIVKRSTLRSVPRGGATGCRAAMAFHQTINANVKDVADSVRLSLEVTILCPSRTREGSGFFFLRLRLISNSCWSYGDEDDRTIKSRGHK